MKRGYEKGRSLSGLFGDEVDGIDQSDGLETATEEEGLDGDADEDEEEDAEDDHGAP